MLLGTRKRGHVAAAAAAAAGPALPHNHCIGSYARPDPPGHSASAASAADAASGRGDDGLGVALLETLGLGSFARLDLPAPPDGLDLTAAVKPSSDCIIVSMGGDSITACPGDVAAALSLPLGKLDPAAEDAALFSSAEAIAAVRLFVHDRLLLGGTGDGQVLPEEIVVSLQLVEDGKAYAVDWGWFVWAFLRSDVLMGTRRRCSRYLLRLMKCQRPDLFSEVDGMSLGKRRKGLTLQQQDILLHGNSGYYDQLMAAEAEVEEGLVFRMGKNIGALEKMPAFGYVKGQQHTTETEDQEDGNHDNANVCPRLHSFRASRQQVVAHVSNLENLASSGVRTLAHTLAEIQQMREKVKEKDNQIKSITEDTKKGLQARSTKLKKLENDEMLMLGTLHGCKRMLQESSAAFLEYRKMCEGSGVSSLDVVADEKNQVHWMQQERDAHEIINGIEKRWLSKFSACDTKITVLLTKLADVNNEVQRLKDSRLIQDLNVVPHL
uniref:Uncharacterized protein n=1 Tax=Avena sativa TaxID=4498 RepID=A0ACD5VT18_AVESA